MSSLNENQKKPRIRVAEAVEAGVEGFFLFLLRYFRTGAIILLRPRSALRQLLRDRHKARVEYVLPLTYLSIGVFLLSLLAQIAGIGIYDWIWFSDEIARDVTTALSQEFSLLKIAIQALPGVLVIAIMTGLQRLLLWGLPRRRRLTSFVFSYAFGAQGSALFIIVFGSMVVGNLIGDGSAFGNETANALVSKVMLVVIGTGLLLSFLGPFAFAFSALSLGRLARASLNRALPAVILLAFSILFGHLGFLYAARIPGIVVTRAKGPTTPSLTLGSLRYFKTGKENTLRISMTITNRGSRPITATTADFRIELYPPLTPPRPSLCGGPSTDLTLHHVENAVGEKVRFASIEPGGTQWFELIGTVKPEKPFLATLYSNVGFGVAAKIRIGESAVDGANCVVRSIEKS